MNGFFEKYADLTALSLTLLASFIITIVLKGKAHKKIRAIPAYFLVFGPSGILAFIFFHLFENTNRASRSRNQQRHFVNLSCCDKLTAG